MTFFNFYHENYLSNKKILNKKKMHLNAKSNHIFFISNFYAFRLFIDYRESTVEFKRRVPIFYPGIELFLFNDSCHWIFEIIYEQHFISPTGRLNSVSTLFIYRVH